MSDLSTVGTESQASINNMTLYPSTQQSTAHTTTPEPGQNPDYDIPEAWINDHKQNKQVIESCEAQVQFPEVSNTEQTSSDKDNNMNLMQEMLKYDDNLNIKGIGTICKISWRE